MSWKVVRSIQKPDIDVSFGSEMSHVRFLKIFFEREEVLKRIGQKRWVQLLIDDDTHRLGFKFFEAETNDATDLNITASALCKDLMGKPWVTPYMKTPIDHRSFKLLEADQNSPIDFYIQF